MAKSIASLKVWFGEGGSGACSYDPRDSWGICDPMFVVPVQYFFWLGRVLQFHGCFTLCSQVSQE